MISLYPDKKLGFVLLSNESGPNSQKALHETAAKIAEALSGGSN